MTRLNVYGIYDTVACKYRNLNLDDREELARRNLAFAVNNDPQLAFMSKDLDFMKIAEFDTETGAVIPCVPAQKICRVADLIGYGEEKFKGEI